MSEQYVDGLALIHERDEVVAELQQAVKIMGKFGREKAMAEQIYKTELMQESLRLRDAGMPVTLIQLVVYGRVAESRFKRDEAEALYATAQEHINVLKLKLRVVESQISREWGGTNG